MDLDETMIHLFSILGIETHDAKRLDGDKLSKFNSLVGVRNEDPIFYTKSNLVLTDKDDFEQLKTAVKKFDEILNIEIPEFQIQLYIGRYVNSPELTSILE
jgi:hypothetical protein